MNEESPLFDSYQIGELTLPNRIIMAPLTRNRAGEGNVPTAMNAEYYRQRASAGLIVSEATQVDPMGQGYPLTPGIHSEKQVEGWKNVTEAVHDAGGRIFLQLWHVGRISHPSYHDGKKPVAPSAVKPGGKTFSKNFGEVAFETPRALDTDEVPEVVDQYRHGASNAREAGFDGVELHAANGYLIDQFLRSKSNRRTDRYGGSAENRIRFFREVCEAVSAVWGEDRVGARLSPLSDFNHMGDDDPEETFTRAAEVAEDVGLSYLHLVEPTEPKPPIVGDGEASAVFSGIREAYGGTLMSNGNYDAESAADAIERGYADVVSFGRAFLANPDLPRRIREGLPINVPDDATYYGGGEEGYTNYPTWEQIQAGESDVETFDSLSDLPAM